MTKGRRRWAPALGPWGSALVALLCHPPWAWGQGVPAATAPRLSPLTPEAEERGAPLPSSPADAGRRLAEAAALRARVAVDSARSLPGRGLGTTLREDLRLVDVANRTAEGEALLQQGRVDDAITAWTELVEHPRFALFEGDDAGRATLLHLGEAMVQVGVPEAARFWFRKVLASAARDESALADGRRALRGLVDVALASGSHGTAAEDLAAASPPHGAFLRGRSDVQGELAYVRGRGREAAGDGAGALLEYRSVPATSRFWSQATYLQGLLLLEAGRPQDAEGLFCKVADPARQPHTVPLVADERFFAVRDLARLALGRVAHEGGRFDDARYYYHLVPQDSDRLAEALHEGATARYEAKDFEGARQLLTDLRGLGLSSPYADEGALLDAYVDLGQCRFAAADEKLRAFVKAYEPLRDWARVSAGRKTLDGAYIASLPPELGARLRRDEAYGAAVKRRIAVDHQRRGLVQARTDLALLTARPGSPALTQRRLGDGARLPVLDGELAMDHRAALDAEEAAARGLLHRTDLRLSRLLARARLGRIETVLGRKRSLELDVEALQAGYLPPEALDSLDAARYLQDGEEYWPFEGERWADEVVGSETARRRGP